MRPILWILAIGAIAPSAVAHGDIIERIKAADRLIAKHPQDARLYLARGELYREHRDFPAAERDYAAALRLDPGLHAVFLARARMLVLAGRLRAAVAAVDRFLSLEPQSAPGWITRARCLGRMGDHSRAAKAWRRALEFARHPQPDHYLSWAHEELSRGPAFWPVAVQCLDLGRWRIGPSIVIDIEALRIETMLHRTAAALRRLDRMAATTPASPHWPLLRGRILEAARRRDEARSAYRRVISMMEGRNRHRRRGAMLSEILREARAALKRLS